MQAYGIADLGISSFEITAFDRVIDRIGMQPHGLSGLINRPIIRLIFLELEPRVQVRELSLKLSVALKLLSKQLGQHGSFLLIVHHLLRC